MKSCSFLFAAESVGLNFSKTPSALRAAPSSEGAVHYKIAENMQLPKPPLCKGRWRNRVATEGLQRKIINI